MSAMATDFIKRFTPTPVETVVELSGTRIRLETNCQAAADQLRRAFAPCTAHTLNAPDFVLRLVAESEDEFEFESGPVVYRLSHDGLSFISLGHKSFLACDRVGRRGISFISESLVKDEKMFEQFMVPALRSLLNEFIDAPL
jgi:hypothetical protein